MGDVRGQRRLLLGAGVGAVVVVLALGGLALAGGDRDERDEIRLEPIGSTFEGDLLAGLDLRTLGSGLAIALPDVPPLGAALGAALDGRAVHGDEPGLYGGSRDVGTCDVDQLEAFLTDPANRGKAAAWADVLGVEVGEIAAFLDELTPVRLRFDTRVTNHGFDGAQATPLQSVLQAGTAVLVDDQGVPRVKCACGNPLLPPAPGGSDAIDATDDDAWDGFDPDRVASVKVRAAVDAFVLVDVDDGVLFRRPVGTDGEADAPVPAGGELCETFSDSPTCTGREALPDVPMPDVAGSRPDAARRALAQLGFAGEVTARVEPSDVVAEGLVIRTEPPAGRTVPVKSPIALVVSSGPADDSTTTTEPTDATATTSSTSSTTSTSSSTTTSTPSSTTTTLSTIVVVPDVVGMTRAEAEATLRDEGLEPQAESDFNAPPDVPDGTVTGQDPEAGRVVPRGSTVRIFVASTIG